MDARIRALERSSIQEVDWGPILEDALATYGHEPSIDEPAIPKCIIQLDYVSNYVHASLDGRLVAYGTLNDGA